MANVSIHKLGKDMRNLDLVRFTCFVTQVLVVSLYVVNACGSWTASGSSPLLGLWFLECPLRTAELDSRPLNYHNCYCPLLRDILY